MKKLSIKLILGLLISCMLLLSTALVTHAQSPHDNLPEDQQPGDRVIVFCAATYLDIWGADNLGNGIFLARIRYYDLLQPGVYTVMTANGQIIADINQDAMFDVRWVGGPYYASGFGDFAKWFTCNVDFSFPIGSSTGNTSSGMNTNTNFGTNQQAGNTGTGVTQNVTIENSPGAIVTINTTTTASCGSQSYTVQAGDNLFRISLRFGTTVSALAACNGINNVALIYVGQVINVP